MKRRNFIKYIAGLIGIASVPVIAKAKKNDSAAVSETIVSSDFSSSCDWFSTTAWRFDNGVATMEWSHQINGDLHVYADCVVKEDGKLYSVKTNQRIPTDSAKNIFIDGNLQVNGPLDAFKR